MSYKDARCMAFTVLSSGDTVGNSNTWSFPKVSKRVNGKDKK